jgi:hypothetical protein
MYLYLGKDVTVPKSEVIGVFDLDNCTYGRTTRDFLSRAEKRGRMTDVSAGALPKSFVLCARERVRGAVGRVYLAQPNPATLLKRWEQNLITQQE